MINAVRGEVGITLDGKEYPMLPTYAAMVAVEQDLGSVVALARRFAMADVTLRELSVVACHCIQAAARERNDSLLVEVAPEVIAEKMYAEGMIPVMRVIDQLLTNMVSGGIKPKKNEGEPTTP